MAKISGLIISMILVSVFMGVIAILMSELSTNYALTYDNSTIELYDSMSKIKNNTELARNQTLGIGGKKDFADILGGVFQAGYTAVITIGNSYDTLENLGEQAAQDANVGEATYLFKDALLLIALVMVVIGIFISVIVKKDI